jgi:hypothetical protein
MDKLHLTGQNLGWVFNFRNGRVHVVHFICYGIKLPNLKLKTWPIKVLVSLQLDIALTGRAYFIGQRLGLNLANFGKSQIKTMGSALGLELLLALGIEFERNVDIILLLGSQMLVQIMPRFYRKYPRHPG